ncbi:MAG: hypothetical protein H7Z12_15895 [Rhodospirillaceae bacterium]|nr:hypothetical protein [Rhodospirillales bacterium]
MLELGAKPERVDASGLSAMDYARKYGHSEIVDALRR